MAMIEIKHKTDEANRQIITYIDTDDLNQEDYYTFRKLQKEGKIFEAIKFIKGKIY